jgi:hypothetical protein
LGLRPLEPERWLECDLDDVEVQMAEKRRVLAEHRSTAVALLDDVDAEATEIRDAIIEWLAEHQPEHLDRYRRDLVAGQHPLEQAAMLVTEDLAIMVERNGVATFAGGVICFPNRWDLPSKLGRPMAEVHAPVARLNEQLEAPIDRFFERLTPERAYWRLGWGVLDTGDLYQAVDGTAASRPGEFDIDAVGPDDVHIRVERETLRRFPATGVVLFTIRTHLTPLRTVIGDPEHAALLAEAIEALPDDVAEYKQLDALGARVIGWLQADV